MKKICVNLLERIMFLGLILFCLYFYGVAFAEKNVFVMIVTVIGIIGALIINYIEIRRDGFDAGVETGMAIVINTEKLMPTEEEATKVFEEVISEYKKKDLDMNSEETIDLMKKEIADRLNLPVDVISLSLTDETPSNTNINNNGDIEIFIPNEDNENENGEDINENK